MSKQTENKEMKMGQVIELLRDREELYFRDNPDCLAFYVEDAPVEDLIENFVRNYQESNVVCTINFDPNYKNSTAENILSILGEEKLGTLLREHSYIKRDDDLYREHWNDLTSIVLDDYESQIDIDEDHEFYSVFKGTEHDAGKYGVSFDVYIYVGMLRLKLDVENFEKALKEKHGFDVEAA